MINGSAGRSSAPEARPCWCPGHQSGGLSQLLVEKGVDVLPQPPRVHLRQLAEATDEHLGAEPTTCRGLQAGDWFAVSGNGHALAGCYPIEDSTALIAQVTRRRLTHTSTVYR